MTTELEWEGIARAYAGESEAEERDRVRGWMAAHPRDAQLLDAVHNAALRLTPDVDVERALGRVRDRIAHEHATRWRSASWAALAASVVAIAVGAWSVVQRRGSERAPVAPTVASAPGARRDARLADGSEVRLGPGSRIVAQREFGKATREVSLDGDAVFSIVHDDARPFIVHAGDAQITDVGTVFVVHADSSSVRVSVISGAVRLQRAGSADAGIVLDAGDRATLAPNAHRTPVREQATADDSAFTSGRLVFRDASLDEVRAALRRWYALELRPVGASLGGVRLTAEFAGEPIDDVLRTIALATNTRIERRGDVAIVRALAEPRRR